MGRMPPALAAYWRKHGRGKSKAKKASKPKRQKSHGGGHTAKKKGKGRKGKRGIIFGMGLFDLGQVADNVGLVGGGEAAQQAMAGDFMGAGNTIASSAFSNLPTIIIHNIGWMLVKKVARKHLGKAAKYF